MIGPTVRPAAPPPGNCRSECCWPQPQQDVAEQLAAGGAAVSGGFPVLAAAPAHVAEQMAAVRAELLHPCEVLIDGQITTMGRRLSGATTSWWWVSR